MRQGHSTCDVIKSPGQRRRADCRSRLLPTNQVRGRTPGARIPATGSQDGNRTARSDLWARRPRAFRHDLQAGGQSFPIFGSGKAFYHPLYIDNFVDALERVTHEGVGDGRTYLIADEEYVTIENLVGRVASAMDRPVRTPHLPFWPLWLAGHAFEKACKPLRIAPPIFPRRVNRQPV